MYQTLKGKIHYDQQLVDNAVPVAKSKSINKDRPNCLCKQRNSELDSSAYFKFKEIGRHFKKYAYLLSF